MRDEWARALEWNSGAHVARRRFMVDISCAQTAATGPPPLPVPRDHGPVFYSWSPCFLNDRQSQGARKGAWETHTCRVYIRRKYLCTYALELLFALSVRTLPAPSTYLLITCSVSVPCLCTDICFAPASSKRYFIHTFLSSPCKRGSFPSLFSFFPQLLMLLPLPTYTLHPRGKKKILKREVTDTKQYHHRPALRLFLAERDCDPITSPPIYPGGGGGGVIQPDRDGDD
ncbi:hypothetical protein LZ31DRAFT_272663 [Colletotrichum somersetense]|nr:hypothetical protein LZ31DRAFT_272663 [Colletotrichum somersetense]